MKPRSARILIAIALIAAVTMGIHETRVAVRLEQQVRELQRSSEERKKQTTDALRSSERENRQLKNTIDAIQEEIRDRLAATHDPSQEEMRSWMTRLNLLTRALEERPDLRIPEMQWLTNEDRLDVARSAKLDTEDGYRRALSALRKKAEFHLPEKISPAIKNFMKDHGKQVPDGISQLEGYFPDPIPADVLQRWQVVSTDKAGLSSFLDTTGEWLVVQRGLVDPDYDYRFGISMNGTVESEALDPTVRTFAKIHEAFQTALGRPSQRLSELWPYATTAEQQAALRRWIIQHPELP